MTTPLPQPPDALIITADDFGLSLPTSRGIIAAHLAGTVNATSLMTVTGDHAAASVALLADAPNLEVGLHLVLTGPGQRPLRAGRSSGLVDRDGQFIPLRRLLARCSLRRIDRAALFDEICAQADLFRTLLGRPPAYVDGHHHAHQFPMVRQALARAVAAGVLPPISRSTVEPPDVRRHVRGLPLRRRIMHRLGLSARPTFAAAGIWTNDYAFGMLTPRMLAEDCPWSDYLAQLPRHGVTEWIVHPGQADPTLATRDSYVLERQTELDALMRLARRADWAAWHAARRTKSGLARLSVS